LYDNYFQMQAARRHAGAILYTALLVLYPVVGRELQDSPHCLGEVAIGKSGWGLREHNIHQEHGRAWLGVDRVVWLRAPRGGRCAYGRPVVLAVA
jgi:hypothetical protein